MAYQVIWSPTALEDIEAIASYISRDSASYAGAVVRRVINSTRNLQNFPFVGRIVPEFGVEGYQGSLCLQLSGYLSH